VGYNWRPKPFLGTQTAAMILLKGNRCKETLVTPHYHAFFKKVSGFRPEAANPRGESILPV
jgi:hypothetical protein